MKKYTMFAILAITAITISACNNKNSNINNKSEALQSYINSDSAVIYYDDYHFNLDTVTVGVAKSGTFNYTNKGKAPLIVSKVFTSCGCVDITYDKDPLMPNQTKSIQFDFTALSSGHFKKAIVVKNNSVNEPVLTIRIEGYAVNNP